jgi:hypothetical protein
MANTLETFAHIQITELHEIDEMLSRKTILKHAQAARSIMNSNGFIERIFHQKFPLKSCFPLKAL